MDFKKEQPILITLLYLQTNNSLNNLDALMNSGLVPLDTDYILLLRRLIKEGFVKSMVVDFTWYNENEFFSESRTFSQKNIGDSKIDNPNFDIDTLSSGLARKKVENNEKLGFFSYIEKMRGIISLAKKEQPHVSDGDRFGNIHPTVYVESIDNGKIDKYINNYIQSWCDQEIVRDSYPFFSTLQQIKLIASKIHENLKVYNSDEILINRVPFKNGDENYEYKYTEVDFVGVLAYLEQENHIKILKFHIDDYPKSYDLNTTIKVLDSFIGFRKKINRQYELQGLGEHTLLYSPGTLINFKGDDIIFTGKQKTLIDIVCKHPTQEYGESGILNNLYGDKYGSNNKLTSTLYEINNKCKETFGLQEQFIKHTGGNFYINPIYSIKSDKKG